MMVREAVATLGLAAALGAVAAGPGRPIARAAAALATGSMHAAETTVLKRIAGGGSNASVYALTPLSGAAKPVTGMGEPIDQTMTPAPPPSPATAATPALQPGAVPSISPGPAATAAAAPAYRFVYRATPSPLATPFPGPGAPQILEIDVTDQYLLTPGRLDVRVVTNPEVQTVTAGTAGYFVTIPRIGPGLFGGTRQIDRVPDFVKNKLFDIDFIATVSNGRTADVVLQLGLK